MKQIIFFLTIILVSSCSKENNNASDVVDTTIVFHLSDKSGNDLFDPTKVYTLNTQNTRMYYLINGQEVEAFCGNCGNPRMFAFGQDNIRYGFIFSPNSTEQLNNTEPITYIQWNETDRDTIQCHIARSKSGSSIVCTKIWYNGELVWNNVGNREFTVIKDN